MAAVLADGTTVIDNAAREPEIVDICQMLQRDGRADRRARVVDADRRGRRPAVADRRTTPCRTASSPAPGPFAAAMTQGDVTVHNARPEHLEIALDKLATAGASVQGTDDGFRVVMDRRPTRGRRRDAALPGLPTDLQPLVIALNAVADGAAMITENIFEGRFVVRQRAGPARARDVRTDGHHAVVRGVPRLSGAPVRATDIRAGAGARPRRAGGGGRHARQRHPPHRPRLPRVRRGAAPPRRRRDPGSRPERGVRPVAAAAPATLRYGGERVRMPRAAGARWARPPAAPSAADPRSWSPAGPGCRPSPAAAGTARPR